MFRNPIGRECTRRAKGRLFFPMLCLAAATHALGVAQIEAPQLAWKPGYRVDRLNVPTDGKPGFSLLSPSVTGLAFTNQLTQSRSLTNQIFLNGSGVAAGDVDGDGWCDIYLCGLDNRNELFRNLGNWKFERITEPAGVGCADQASTGAALADMDGDGDLDLVVNAIAGGTRLFQNDGRARFTEITVSAGLRHNGGSMSLAIADVNGDGYLDLYVVNYRSSTFRDEPEKRFRVVNRGGKYEVTTVDGRPVTEPDLVGRFTIDPVFGLMEHGEPDILFINEAGRKFRRLQWGDGTFAETSGAAMPAPHDWGLSAMFRDLNGDRAPDLYVCNDFQSPDRIWLNDRTGKFRSAPQTAFRQTSLFSMGVDFADLDNDGHEEIFVADMLSRIHERRQTQVMDGTAALVLNRKFESRPQYTRNTLFWNRGNGTYSEIAQLAGLEATEWSWCPVFMDVDLDGRRDLLVTTGHERDAQHIDVAREIDAAKKRKAPWRELIELRRKFPPLKSPILAFRNAGNLAFTEATQSWGFTTEQISHGIALADLDNDGDQDLVASCLNSAALLYRNDNPQPRLAIELRGTPPNTRGVGARVTVQFPGLPLQSDGMSAAGRYLSSDDFQRTFAAVNDHNGVITVHWPAGKVTVVSNVIANSALEIEEASARQMQVSQHVKPTITPIFENVSAALNHSHQDPSFDDFQRQLLLPRKFSELGPAISWFDLDNDGWEDLFIGSGRGGKLASFKNEKGKLSPWLLQDLSGSATRDHAGILGLQRGTNRNLLVALSTYEDASTNSASVRQFTPAGTPLADVLGHRSASVGALAAADADADGDLDLFVAGRIVPGRYPQPAAHFFLRNDNGSFSENPELNLAFQNVGLVSAAIWSDLDNNGIPELLLAVDGGPLRTFRFTQDRFVEISGHLGLDRWTGFWQSIITGDFNNDGQLDLVAGNIGRNSKYQRYMPDRYSFYFGDLNADGTMQCIEAFRDQQSGKTFPLFDRDTLALGLPDLRQRFPSFAAFSTATVPEILGMRMEKARELRINTTESMLFLRDGQFFRAHPLPLHAQVSPVFGLAVGDVNADGHQDLFLNQNLFSVGKDTSRYDAGEGVLLLGNGSGELTPMPAAESGVQINGDGRGAAFCDFDHDGRLDLVSAQNSGPTMLYRNASSRRGLRVSVKFGASNPDGVGATLRPKYKDSSLGPLQEIRAGEGYWSQGSSTIILGRRDDLDEILVTWPGGEKQTVTVPAGLNELLIKKAAGN